MTPRKICFWGLFGQQNLGNECTLQAIIHNVRRYLPQAEMVCVCTVPEDTSARHHIAAHPITQRFRPLSRRAAPRRGGNVLTPAARVLARVAGEIGEAIRAFRILWRSDMVVVPGTGFLTDASTGPLGWPYEIFKWSLIAKACGCRLVYVSVGVGPIHRRSSRWLIKWALALADFRSYRDDSSKTYLDDIGFRTADDRVYPDLAFNLPDELIPRAGHGQPRRVVGIGLMTRQAGTKAAPHRGAVGQPYLDVLAGFARWLLAAGYDVRLLIGDVVYDERAQRDFRELLDQQLPAEARARIIDEPIASVEDLLAQLAATDFVVATRFHNLLLALVLDKPVISISFHHKCASLMSDMGLSQYCQDIDELAVERLIEQFGEVEKRHAELAPLIRRKREEFRSALDDQYAALFSAEPTPAAVPARAGVPW